MGVSFIAGICKEIEQPASRARPGGNPEGMSDEELLERYLISRQTSDARRERLIDAARPIFEAGDGSHEGSNPPFISVFSAADRHRKSGMAPVSASCGGSQTRFTETSTVAAITIWIVG
ncbi:MAG: hypothetical protein U0670_18990 [Anaerolineae bacterium]